jgi:hypothetical protein
LAKLQYIELSNNQITKVDPLSGMTSLSALYMSGNQISDLSPLGGLAKLSSLSLPQNQIKDVGPLAKVTKLSLLDLNDNQIEDVTPLAKQTEISMLLLERNKIADLTPLVTAAKADVFGKVGAPDACLILAAYESVPGRGGLAACVLLAACEAPREGEKRFAPYLRLYLKGNPLSEAAKSSQLPALKGFGVRIESL